MTEAIRVASVPADHVYVRHLAWPGDGISRLPDPPTDGPGWWPPAMLDPDWVRSHHREFDLFHVHFGFDGKSAAEVAELCDSLGRLGKPLVYTAHDLRNPHHPEPRIHSAQLDVLMDRADRILTLTRRARGQIEERFGRGATVLPHPHVVPLEVMETIQRRSCHGYPTVGIHLKSLRANISAGAAISALARDDAGDHFRLRVDIHTDAWEEGPRELVVELRRLYEAGRIDLRIHDYFTDEEFLRYLASLDVAVLPYTFGTHSGWLEACRDLGTAVVVPDCGCYSDQGRVFEFHLDEDSRPSEPSLRRAVRKAREAVGRATVEHLDPGSRRAQRVELSRAHRSIYEAVLTERSVAAAR